MRIFRWSRQFGFRRWAEMEAELICERLAAVALAFAKWADPEIARAIGDGEEARKVAYSLVYGKIDGPEAARRFYGIYY